MKINDYEQQQLVYCWLREANMYGEHPVLYAGHKMKNETFSVRFFLMKPVNGTSQYGTIHIPYEQVKTDLTRFRISEID